MRRNESLNKHTKMVTIRHGAELKVAGLPHNNKTAVAANLQNHDGLYEEHYPQASNLVWSYHLITMPRAHGLVISILSILDEHTQECLRCVADDHISAETVTDELFSLFLRKGVPRYLFAFNDDDAMPNTICEWLEKIELNSIFVELKKYGENGYGAMFKDKLIRDLLQAKKFASLTDVQIWLANWREEHNRSINLWSISQ